MGEDKTQPTVWMNHRGQRRKYYWENWSSIKYFYTHTPLYVCPRKVVKMEFDVGSALSIISTINFNKQLPELTSTVEPR